MTTLISHYFAKPGTEASADKTRVEAQQLAEERQTSLEARLLAEIARLDGRVDELITERDQARAEWQRIGIQLEKERQARLQLETSLKRERQARLALAAQLHDERDARQASEAARRQMSQQIQEQDSKIHHLERELKQKTRRIHELEERMNGIDTGPLS